MLLPLAMLLITGCNGKFVNKISIDNSLCRRAFAKMSFHQNDFMIFDVFDAMNICKVDLIIVALCMVLQLLLLITIHCIESWIYFQLSSYCSTVSTSKVVVEPMLVDDDSDDSMGEYAPSPIVPLVKTSEPTDLFARITAQMEEEEADQFSLVNHQARPGEEVFTPIGELSKREPSAAHSTPISAESKSAAVGNRGKKSKSKDKKVVTPASDIFNMLMATDEPEYAVDDTLPNRSRPGFYNEIKSEVAESDAVADTDVSVPSVSESRAEDPTVGIDNRLSLVERERAMSETNPFTDTSRPVDDDHVIKASGDLSNSKPLENSARLVADVNPFEESLESKVEDTKDELPDTSVSINVSATANTLAVASNPFEDPPAESQSINPFEEDDSSVNPRADSKIETSMNPFGDPEPQASLSTNPFDDSAATPSASNNPFEDSEARNNTPKNPFDEEAETPGSNPFEDDDDDERTSSFRRDGSFVRKGSSRFAGSTRRKKREAKKDPAPPPPKPRRSFTESLPQGSVADTPTDASHPEAVVSKPPVQASPPTKDSPRHRSKKDKRAPEVPATGGDVTSSRGRSQSHNTTSAEANSATVKHAAYGSLPKTRVRTYP